MGDLAPVETVNSIPGLSAEQRQLILGGNVARLLESMNAGYGGGASSR